MMGFFEASGLELGRLPSGPGDFERVIRARLRAIHEGEDRARRFGARGYDSVRSSLRDFVERVQEDWEEGLEDCWPELDGEEIEDLHRRHGEAYRMAYRCAVLLERLRAENAELKARAAGLEERLVASEFRHDRLERWVS